MPLSLVTSLLLVMPLSLVTPLSLVSGRAGERESGER